jgi:general secretion pathway protein D
MRLVKKAVGLIVIVFFLGLSGNATPASKNESASSLYKKGIAAEAQEDIESAFEYYHQAFERDGASLRYKTAYERMRVPAASVHVHRGEQLVEQAELRAAVVEFMRALEIDPSNERAQQNIRAAQGKLDTPVGAHAETSLVAASMSAMNRMRSPVELKPLKNEPITLNVSEDSKVLYQTIGKLAGINVIFDPELISKRVQIQVTDVSLEDAMGILASISGTFWHPVTANTIFVAQATRAKRAELDQQGVQTFYLSNASQQNDLNDIQTALRNVLVNAKLYGVPSQNAIVMRGTPDELALAQKLINDLDKARPEVVVDVAVLEVTRDKLRNMGIQLPQSATVNLQASTSTSSSSSSSSTSTSSSSSTSSLTLNTLGHLNGTNFALTVGQAQAEMLLTDSDTKVLQNPRVRATDGQQATLKIGSRIPIATGSYSAGVSATSTTGVQTQFQYIDVGVNIDIKPTIHYNRDVTMKLKIEVSAQNGSSTISGVTEPIISQRTIDQNIRLKEGEANIVGGLLERDESLTVSGAPGLGEVPFLKYLFSTQEKEVKDDEIVFLIIPHVVRGIEISPLNLRQIDTGTGTNVEVRRTQASDNFPLLGVSGQQTPKSSSVSAFAGPSSIASGSESTAPQSGDRLPALHLSPSQTTARPQKDLQIAVNVVDGRDVFSVPVQIQYDPVKLTLLSVDRGDFLGKDGQTVALTDQDDGNGEVTISASRPPGVAGVSGTGSLCVLKFKAKATGDTLIKSTSSIANNSRKQTTYLAGAEATVHIE